MHHSALSVDFLLSYSLQRPRALKKGTVTIAFHLYSVVTISEVENSKASIIRISPPKSEGPRFGIQVSTQGLRQSDAAIPFLLRSRSVPCSSARDRRAPSEPSPAARNKPASQMPDHRTIRQPFLSYWPIPRSLAGSPLANHNSGVGTFPVHSGFS